MLKSVKCFVLLLLLLGLSGNRIFAQLNLYSRITDHRAIARLDGPDCEPLRYVNRFGYPNERDPLDNNFILAQDTGENSRSL